MSINNAGIVFLSVVQSVVLNQTTPSQGNSDNDARIASSDVWHVSPKKILTIV